MSNPRATLRKWFNDRQIAAYFGARTDAELGEIAWQMSRMTPAERVRFKRALAGFGRAMDANGRRN